jgi:hypothetical protein
MDCGHNTISTTSIKLRVQTFHLFGCITGRLDKVLLIAFVLCVTEESGFRMFVSLFHWKPHLGASSGRQLERRNRLEESPLVFELICVDLCCVHGKTNKEKTKSESKPANLGSGGLLLGRYSLLLQQLVHILLF